jgi:hypothetical protein
MPSAKPAALSVSARPNPQCRSPGQRSTRGGFEDLCHRPAHAVLRTLYQALEVLLQSRTRVRPDTVECSDFLLEPEVTLLAPADLRLLHYLILAACAMSVC